MGQSGNGKGRKEAGGRRGVRERSVEMGRDGLRLGEGQSGSGKGWREAWRGARERVKRKGDIERSKGECGRTEGEGAGRGRGKGETGGMQRKTGRVGEGTGRKGRTREEGRERCDRLRDTRKGRWEDGKGSRD